VFEAEEDILCVVLVVNEPDAFDGHFVLQGARKVMGLQRTPLSNATTNRCIARENVTIRRWPLMV
jgi:hypothetical protein